MKVRRSAELVVVVVVFLAVSLGFPHLGTIPLVYEQFRLMFGVQIGA